MNRADAYHSLFCHGLYSVSGMKVTQQINGWGSPRIFLLSFFVKNKSVVTFHMPHAGRVTAAVCHSLFF